jgi:hypothetical protein
MEMADLGRKDETETIVIKPANSSHAWNLNDTLNSIPPSQIDIRKLSKKEKSGRITEYIPLSHYQINAPGPSFKADKKRIRSSPMQKDEKDKIDILVRKRNFVTQSEASSDPSTMSMLSVDERVELAVENGMIYRPSKFRPPPESNSLELTRELGYVIIFHKLVRKME